MSALLPAAFSTRELKNELAILHPKSSRFAVSGKDGLEAVAENRINQSYSPYSRSPSALAIQTMDSQVFSGAYIENVAFNPSLSPLQAALIQRAFSPSRDSTIVDALLVEAPDAKISQLEVTRSILEVLAPECQLRHCWANSIDTGK